MEARVRRTLPPTLLALLLALLGAAPASAHPQDGPHCDVRGALRDDALELRLSMNLVFLDAMVATPRESPDVIAAAELEGVRAALLEHLVALHPVTIDGVVVEPTAGPLTASDPDPALLPLFPLSGMRGLRKVEITLRYPIAAPPRRISFVWRTFPPDVLSDPDDPPPLEIAAELVAEGRRHDMLFTTAEPEVVWHATGGTIEEALMPLPEPPAPHVRLVPILPILLAGFALAGLGVLRATGRRLSPPLLAAVLAGMLVAGWAGRGLVVAEIARPARAEELPEAVEAARIFETLHANLYRAFDFAAEGDVYDALARSVDGPLLERVYDDVYRGLVMMEEGGAVGRVAELQPRDTAIESIGVIERDGAATEGFAVRHRWRVRARVVHWGHAHERTIAYDARYAVAATPEGWRIVGVEVLDQEPVEEAPPLLFDGDVEL